jgi:hypothetical protein
MQQLYGWVIEAELPAASRLSERTAGFRLETGGEILRACFQDVRMDRLDACLMVPAVEPVISYMESMELVPAPDTDPGMAALRARLDAELKLHGTLRIDADSGLLEARGPVSPRS